MIKQCLAIGRDAKDVSENALDYVAAYTCGNHISPRNCREMLHMRAAFHNGDSAGHLIFRTARPVLGKLKADRRPRKVGPEDSRRRQSETR